MGRTKTSFDSIPEQVDPIYGSCAAVVDALVAKHALYKLDNVSRTYLFVGRPGTAKSTAAVRVAEAHGDRMLQISAKSFEHMDERQANFLLKSLEPEFLIVDDLDKAAVNSAMPTILGIMQRFKRSHSRTTVILTANDDTKLDEALLRPGRIDRIVRFPDPDAADRYIILDKYLQKHSVKIAPESLASIVSETDGLTGAWLAEVALLLRYDSPEDVLPTIREMISIATRAKSLLKAEEPAAAPARPFRYRIGKSSS